MNYIELDKQSFACCQTNGKDKIQKQKRRETIVHNKKLERSMEQDFVVNVAVLWMIKFFACLIFFTFTLNRTMNKIDICNNFYVENTYFN